MQSTHVPNQANQLGRLTPGRRPTGNNVGLTQAYEIRDAAATQAIEIKSEPADSLEEKALRARAFKDCTTVWMVACDRIRIIRKQPLPGSLRPERKPKKVRPISSTPSESPDPGPEPKA